MKMEISKNEIKKMALDYAESSNDKHVERYHAFISGFEKALKVVNKTNDIHNVSVSDCECSDRHEDGIVWSAKTSRYIKCKCKQTEH